MTYQKTLFVVLSLSLFGTASAGEYTAHWLAQPAPTAKNLRAIGGGSSIFIVGDQGTILAQNGATWREMGIADGIKPDLYAVTEVGPDSYAVGTANETAVFIRRSGGAWQSIAIDINGPLPFAFYGVWGSNKDVYAVGKKGKAVRYSVDTNKFVACADTRINTDLFAITGNSRDGALYAVGAGGTILRSTDGCTSWSNLTNKVVSGADLTAVAVGSSDEIYAIGKDGALLVSKDKGSFTSLASRLPPAGPRSFSGIIVAGGEITISSREGKILHSRDFGQTWSSETSCSQGALTSLWRSPSGDVYTVGEFGAILRAPVDTTLEIQVRDNAPTFAGAEVFIDGELFKTIPLASPVLLPPGRHFVQVKKSGFVDFSQWIDLVEGRNTPLWLTALRSSSVNPTVTLNVTNGKQALSDATIWVNGIQSKTAPGSTLELTPGRYLLEVKKAGYDDFSAWVELQETQKNQISVLLSESTQEPKLDLLHKPEDAMLLKGASVFFDGELVGPFPLMKPPPLAPGRHLIEVRKDGYEAFTAWVSLKKGEISTLYLSLRAEPSDVWLEIKTRPEDAAIVKGAEVFLNGESLGSLPLAKAPMLSLGRQHIEIRKLGYQTESYWLQLKPGDTASISYFPESSKDASLQIEAEKGAPALDGAMLWVDGIAWGAVALGQAKPIAAGRHLIELKKDGFESFSQWVEISKDKGKARSVMVRLEPLKPPATPTSQP